MGSEPLPLLSQSHGWAGVGDWDPRALNWMWGSDLKPAEFVITESDQETVGSAWAIGRRRKAEFDRVRLTTLIRESVKPFCLYPRVWDCSVNQLHNWLQSSYFPFTPAPQLPCLWGNVTSQLYLFAKGGKEKERTEREKERKAPLEGYLQGHTEAQGAPFIMRTPLS